jgi:hypothetical protein
MIHEGLAVSIRSPPREMNGRLGRDLPPEIGDLDVDPSGSEQYGLKALS